MMYSTMFGERIEDVDAAMGLYGIGRDYDKEYEELMKMCDDPYSAPLVSMVAPSYVKQCRDVIGLARQDGIL